MERRRRKSFDNFPAHYLMDIMKKNWKGSGDSKLFDRTWMKDRTGNDFVPDHFYRHEITRDMFMYEFRAWNTELMMKRQTTRPNLQKDVLVALQFLYTGIVSHLANKSTQFEIEHVFPVKFCADRIAANNDDGWPISAIGNLMFLEKTVNRIKGEKLSGDRGSEALTPQGRSWRTNKGLLSSTLCLLRCPRLSRTQLPRRSHITNFATCGLKRSERKFPRTSGFLAAGDLALD